MYKGAWRLYTNLVRRKKVYSVYILKCADGTLYTGIAKDLLKRVAVHNSGLGAKYTRARLPVEVVYTAHPFTKSAALKLEVKIKKLSRPEKFKLFTELK